MRPMQISVAGRSCIRYKYDHRKSVGLGYAFLIRPMASPLAQKYLGVPMDALDMGTLGTLLFGMLGLGGMRTVEKINGVAAK